MTSKKVRKINSETTSPVSSNIIEFKVDLNLHIRETIEQVISDQVLPSIRETLSGINDSVRPNVDLTSSERHRSPETHLRKKIWENVTKSNKSVNNHNHHKRANSFEPHIDEDYDIYENLLIDQIFQKKPRGVCCLKLVGFLILLFRDMEEVSKF